MAAVEHDLVSMIHEAPWWNRVIQVLTASGTNYKNAANRLRMLTAAGIIHSDMRPEQVLEQHGFYETRKMLHLLAGEKADRAREMAVKDALLTTAQKNDYANLIPLFVGGAIVLIAIRWIMRRII